MDLMTETEAVKLLIFLLELEANQLRDWLHRVWEGKEQIPADFHWLALAEAIACRARSESDMSGFALISREVGHYCLLITVSKELG